MTCLKCGHNPDAVVLATWQTMIPRAVNSGNARIHNVGASRWAYKAERQGWERDMLAVRLAMGIPVATTRRRVTLTRLIDKGQRAFDEDNLRTGCKPIVDAMVKAGMLVGDRPQDAEIHYAQTKAIGGGLYVELEEVQP